MTGKLKTEKFSVWIDRTRKAQKTGGDIDVPCGECNACCTSSYFIHINHDEHETLSSIPEELKFPAPGFHDGSIVFGYDRKGRCPMLKDNKCTIYNSRPRTCRNYDCRVYSAAGISPGENKKLIARQTAEWEFSFSDEDDYNNFSALRRAADFIINNQQYFPPGFLPVNTPQQIILAVKTLRVFLNMPDESFNSGSSDDKKNIAEKIISEYESFENS